MNCVGRKEAVAEWLEVLSWNLPGTAENTKKLIRIVTVSATPPE
jgi:hypothetical protein